MNKTEPTPWQDIVSIKKKIIAKVIDVVENSNGTEIMKRESRSSSSPSDDYHLQFGICPCRPFLRMHSHLENCIRLHLPVHVTI